jgi:hypothetical protein
VALDRSTDFGILMSMFGDSAVPNTSSCIIADR